MNFCKPQNGIYTHHMKWVRQHSKSGLFVYGYYPREDLTSTVLRYLAVTFPVGHGFAKGTLHVHEMQSGWQVTDCRMKDAFGPPFARASAATWHAKKLLQMWDAYERLDAL